MDWPNERYARLYTRDTMTWKLMNWQARCVLPLLIRKVDRAGVLELGEHTNPTGLSVMIDVPVDVVEPGITKLLELQVVTIQPGSHYFVVKFIEAQEASQNDAQRQ